MYKVNSESNLNVNVNTVHKSRGSQYKESNKNNNINDDAMFASEDYRRIMHNINNEGNYTDYIFEEEHDNYTVPIIYTKEEDDKMIREINEMMFIPTPKSNRSMKQTLQQDIAPVCIVRIKYIGGIRLDHL